MGSVPNPRQPGSPSLRLSWDKCLQLPALGLRVWVTEPILEEEVEEGPCCPRARWQGP